MNKSLALLLVLSALLSGGAHAASGWSEIEITSSSRCKDLPTRIVDPCLAHKGNSAPFRYIEVSASEACVLLKDSANRPACREEVLRGLPFAALTSEVATPESRASVGIGSFEERTALAAERTANASERTALVVTIQFALSLAAAAVLVALSLRD